MMWPLAVYFGFVVFLAAAVLIVSYLLGQRHSEPATGEPYEGGIVSEDPCRGCTLSVWPWPGQIR